MQHLMITVPSFIQVWLPDIKDPIFCAWQQARNGVWVVWEWYGNFYASGLIDEFRSSAKTKHLALSPSGVPQKLPCFLIISAFFSYRIGWWENLQEKTQKNDGKNHGFQLRFSLKPILFIFSHLKWSLETFSANSRSERLLDARLLCSCDPGWSAPL
jgi:hypothetical protein